MLPFTQVDDSRPPVPPRNRNGQTLMSSELYLYANLDHSTLRTGRKSQTNPINSFIISKNPGIEHLKLADFGSKQALFRSKKPPLDEQLPIHLYIDLDLC